MPAFFLPAVLLMGALFAATFFLDVFFLAAFLLTAAFFLLAFFFDTFFLLVALRATVFFFTAFFLETFFLDTFFLVADFFLLTFFLDTFLRAAVFFLPAFFLLTAARFFEAAFLGAFFTVFLRAFVAGALRVDRFFAGIASRPPLKIGKRAIIHMERDSGRGIYPQLSGKGRFAYLLGPSGRLTSGAGRHFWAL